METAKLYVGNLKYSVDNEQLTELFSQYGNLTSVKVIEGRGFGFVEFSSPEEAENAKNSLNGTDFKGRTLRIDEAKPQQRRRHSNSYHRDNQYNNR